jgi:hypothetical protein
VWPAIVLGAVVLSLAVAGVAVGVGAGSAGLIPRQQAQLTAGDAAELDEFGRAVALAGDTALVGAPEHGAAGLDGAGAAYVSTRTGEAWAQQALLLAADAAPWDAFGAAVAISGDTALVGAPGRANGADEEAGAAYVFARTDGVWTQQAQLLASDAAALDSFGAAVALSGNTAVIGAPYHTVSGDVEAGAAYVFTRTGATWTEQAVLTAADPGAGDWLGTSVAVDGDTALAGADGRGAGAAYVFTRSGAAWAQQGVLQGAGAVDGDFFGASVALHGDVALVGAPAHDAAGAPGAGAAYTFMRMGAVWAQEAALAGPTPAADDSFGSSVSLTAGTALVGAEGRDAFGITDAGAAYTFLRTTGVWSWEAALTATDAAAGDQLGGSVSLSGRTALAGADGHATGGLEESGAAYVFTLDGLPIAPAVFSFSPTAAPVGKTVTLIGEGFTGATAVAFTGPAAATFSVLSDARLTATVPTGAKTGPITVTTPLGSAATATSFTIQLPARISKARPSALRRGAVLTITGKRFGAKRGTSKVTIGSVRCRTYLSWKDGRIRCKIPRTARFGRVAVRVTTEAGRSNAKYVRVRR